MMPHHDAASSQHVMCYQDMISHQDVTSPQNIHSPRARALARENP